MPYKFVSDSFHTGVTCETLRVKIDDFAPTRSLGKRVVDFLLALIKLFSLGVTVEELRAIIG